MGEAEEELARLDPTRPSAGDAPGAGTGAGTGAGSGTGDRAEDAAVAQALRAASAWVGDTVSVVGVGALPEGDPCIVVHTTAPASVPDEVAGVPVVTVVAEPPHALADDEGDGASASPA